MSIQDWRNRLIRTSQFPYFNYDEFTSYKEKKTFPMAMICLLIDDDLMIAVGCVIQWLAKRKVDTSMPKDFPGTSSVSLRDNL